VDVLLFILSIWASTNFAIQDYITFDNESIYMWLFVLIFYYFLFGEVFQLYALNVSSSRFKVSRSLFLTTFVTTLFFMFTPYFSPSLPENRIQIIYFFGLIFVPVLIWRFIYMWIFFAPKYFKDIIVISHSSRMTRFLNLISDRGFHNVICYVSDEQSKDYGQFFNVKETDIYQLVKEKSAKEVILSTRGFSSDVIARINREIIALFEEGINIKSFESFYEEITDRVPKEFLDHNFYKNINLSSSSDNKFYQVFRRVLDIIISSIGLLFFLVLLPVIVLLNLVGNRGPIFYTQNRVGRKGKVFRIFKLRSMVVNAEKQGAQYAVKNDTRITTFGKFLRNTRLDEVPQFFNILKGDMSLIGPRPERPEFVEDLREKIPFYAIRHVVKPGLTGWAQVNFPYANNLDEQEKKLRYDLFYIKEQSAFLDFKIIIKTITTILFFRGQ
jgi:exopolysaccharide biosynthesis polyprenyl glycosylphosphotransferase